MYPEETSEPSAFTTFMVLFSIVVVFFLAFYVSSARADNELPQAQAFPIWETVIVTPDGSPCSLTRYHISANEPEYYDMIRCGDKVRMEKVVPKMK